MYVSGRMSLILLEAQYQTDKLLNTKRRENSEMCGSHTFMTNVMS